METPDSKQSDQFMEGFYKMKHFKAQQSLCGTHAEPFISRGSSGWLYKCLNAIKEGLSGNSFGSKNTDSRNVLIHKKTEQIHRAAGMVPSAGNRKYTSDIQLPVGRTTSTQTIYCVYIFTVFYCTILYYSELYCIYTVLYCTVLHSIILYSTALYYTTLHSIILYFTICYSIIL